MRDMISKMKMQLIFGRELSESFDRLEEKFKEVLYNSNLPSEVMKKYELAYEREILSRLEVSTNLKYLVKS